MCRNIRTLFNFEPPASEDEIQAAAAVRAQGVRLKQAVASECRGLRARRHRDYRLDAPPPQCAAHDSPGARPGD